MEVIIDLRRESRLRSSRAVRLPRRHEQKNLQLFSPQAVFTLRAAMPRGVERDARARAQLD